MKMGVYFFETAEEWQTFFDSTFTIGRDGHWLDPRPNKFPCLMFIHDVTIAYQYPEYEDYHHVYRKDS